MEISIMLAKEIAKLFLIMFMGYTEKSAICLCSCHWYPYSFSFSKYPIAWCITSECDRAGKYHLPKCRNSDFSSGSGTAGTGLYHLFQYLHDCSAG